MFTFYCNWLVCSLNLVGGGSAEKNLKLIKSVQEKNKDLLKLYIVHFVWILSSAYNLIVRLL